VPRLSGHNKKVFTTPPKIKNKLMESGSNFLARANFSKPQAFIIIDPEITK